MNKSPNFFQATAQRVLDAALAHDGYYITVDNAHDSARQATLDVIANTLKTCVEASIHHYAREKIMAEFLGPAHPHTGRIEWGSALGRKVGKEFAEAHQLLEWLVPAVYKGDPFCTEEQRRKRQWLELAGEYGYEGIHAVRWAYRRYNEQSLRSDFGPDKVKFGEQTVQEPLSPDAIDKTFNDLIGAVDRGLQATGAGRVVTDFHTKGYPAAEDAAGDDGPLVPAGMSSAEASERAAQQLRDQRGVEEDRAHAIERAENAQHKLREMDHNGWVLGVEEGEPCNADLHHSNPNDRCEGKMQYVRAEPCTCMHNPQGVPCYGCSNSVLRCDTCDREAGE